MEGYLTGDTGKIVGGGIVVAGAVVAAVVGGPAALAIGIGAFVASKVVDEYF